MTRGRVGLPYLLVLAGAAAGLGAMALGLPAWAGSLVVSAALLGGAVARLAGPDGGQGLLAVRGRRADAVTFALIGGALAVVALTVALPEIVGRG
ncbi:hypothetical protein Sru01_05500 [Sphaerisporangium rufum]|uniref:DUF3017 domain-containing protein n=1 Tax=Sphaerisporangium rufum TaxID=1381558 RepID=A0A919UZG8_9ACTN|nr:DUF3017 domain-containing protein [Sphaerisporangium rufum]GII75568.1 hypothetical protein Sru01_05500 [Sphaerisporangium rufum]